RELLALRGHQSQVSGLAFHPTEPQLASGGIDGTLRLWDIDFAGEIMTLGGHYERPYAVTFSPNEQQLVVVGSYGLVEAWEIESGLPLLSLPGLDTDVYAVALSPDGQRVATAGWDTVHIWNAATGVLLQQLNRTGSQHTA